MANVHDVTAEGRLVRDGLQRLIDNGDYTEDEADELANAHFLLARRLGDFALRPADGPDSPAYDAVLVAIQLANAAVKACRPGESAALAKVFSAVGAASTSLGKVTASSAAVPARGFASALAIRKVGPVAGKVAGTRSAVPGVAAVSQPTEPYLTSLAKLFPAEALSALLLVLSIDPQFTQVRNVLIALIVVASGVLRYFTTRDPDTGKPDLLAIVVSVVSFLIFSAAMLAFGVLFNTNEATTRIIATIVAILWMAILTVVIRRAPAS